MNKRRTTLIFTHGGGRLANQISNLTHLYAFYLEQSPRLTLVDMAFWNYRRHFEDAGRFLQFPKAGMIAFMACEIHDMLAHMGTRAQQTFYFMLHMAGNIFPFAHSIRSGSANPKNAKLIRNGIDLAKNEDIEFLLSRRLTFLCGWTIRSWDLVKKHEDAIRTLLRPATRYRIAAENFIRPLRKDYDYLIGVQIRQTDYRDYMEGRFYFSSEIYVTWIRQLKTVFAAKGKIAVVLASDEQQDRALFAMDDVFWATGAPNGTGHYLEDFVTLSLCDLIVAPPSTFAAWAGFSGRTPWLPLIENSQTLDPESVLQDAVFDGIRHPLVAQVIRQ